MDSKLRQERHQSSELTQQVKSLEGQNKQLLQKNQNDLIMVRQKEAALKKAQDSIDEERNSFKAVTDRLKFDNDYLRLEIEKMKGRIPAQSEVDSRNQQLTTLAGKNQELLREVQELKEAIGKHNQKNTEQIESLTHLQKERENLQRLLEAQQGTNSDLQKSVDVLRTAVTRLNVRNEELERQLHQIPVIEKPRLVSFSVQTEKDSSEEDAEKHNKQSIQKLQQQIDKIQAHAKLLQSRLRETNEILKSVNLKNTLLVEENTAMKKSAISLEESVLKHKAKAEEEKRKAKENLSKSTTSESDQRAKELQQQNKLLKEMLRSVQTMVRVRESEVERYKNKTEAIMESQHRVEAKHSVKKLEDIGDRPRLPKIPQGK